MFVIVSNDDDENGPWVYGPYDSDESARTAAYKLAEESALDVYGYRKPEEIRRVDLEILPDEDKWGEEGVSISVSDNKNYIGVLKNDESKWWE